MVVLTFYKTGDLQQYSASFFFFEFFTFEDGTDRLSRNVGKELSLYTA